MKKLIISGSHAYQQIFNFLMSDIKCLSVQEMTQAQMVLEKITLQKCLLYFESLHGRPVSPPTHTLQDRVPRFQRHVFILQLHERSLLTLCCVPGNEAGEEPGEASVRPIPDDQTLAVCQPHHQHHRKTHTCRVLAGTSAFSYVRTNKVSSEKNRNVYHPPAAAPPSGQTRCDNSSFELFL